MYRPYFCKNLLYKTFSKKYNIHQNNMQAIYSFLLKIPRRYFCGVTLNIGALNKITDVTIPQHNVRSIWLVNENR